MPRNLRSVIERVTRGGRSVVSRRNFSSSLSRYGVSEGSGYFVAQLLSFAAGYGMGYGNSVLLKIIQEMEEEIEEKYRQKVEQEDDDDD